MCYRKFAVIIAALICILGIPALASNAPKIVGSRAYYDGKWYDTWTHYEYDAKGNNIHEKNSYGTAYDPEGNRIYVSEYWYEYDSKGNLIHVKDSLGTESWFDYDSKGNRIHEKASDGLECWLEYDDNGNIIKQKNPDGSEWRWEHDAHGNCIYMPFSNGREEWYEYEYDIHGNKIYEKMHDSSDSSSICWLEYDGKGNNIHETRSHETAYDSAGDYEVWIKYDGAGNKINEKNVQPDGSVFYELDTYDSHRNNIYKKTTYSDGDISEEWNTYIYKKIKGKYMVEWHFTKYEHQYSN